jgi:hypothetical protein
MGSPAQRVGLSPSLRIVAVEGRSIVEGGEGGGDGGGDGGDGGDGNGAGRGGGGSNAGDRVGSGDGDSDEVSAPPHLDVIDRFALAVADKKDGEPVQLTCVDLRGKVRLIVLQTDAHHFPSYTHTRDEASGKWNRTSVGTAGVQGSGR